MKIKDFADINSGYAFRGAILEDPNGDTRTLQAKDIKMGDYISETTNLMHISSGKVKKPIFLADNDIVIVSRGRGIGSFKAAIFKSTDSNVIPTSSLLVVRIKDHIVVPDFVVSFLNSPEGQAEVLKHVASGVFQVLMKKGLAEIDIPLPAFEKQKIIADLSKNIYLQEVLSSRLATVKRTIFNNIMQATN